MFRVMISGRAMANLSYKLNQATPTDSALSLINILDILEDFYRYESFSIMTSNDPKAPWFGVEWPRVTSRSTFHFGILFAQVSKFSDFDLKWPQLPPYLGSGQRSVSGTRVPGTPRMVPGLSFCCERETGTENFPGQCSGPVPNSGSGDLENHFFVTTG